MIGYVRICAIVYIPANSLHFGQSGIELIAAGASPAAVGSGPHRALHTQWSSSRL